jgi:Fic family protein
MIQRRRRTCSGPKSRVPEGMEGFFDDISCVEPTPRDLQEELELVSSLVDQTRALNLLQMYQFAHYSRVNAAYHSTALEGSTLSYPETQVLIEHDVPAAGKPFEHSEMVKDLYEAAEMVWSAQQRGSALTVVFLKELNARVLHRTGTSVSSPLGLVDTRKGDFRLSSVTAGGGHMYPDAKKVPTKLAGLVGEWNADLGNATTTADQLQLAYRVHYELVALHPWYDGNGRTSRLAQNWVELRFGILPMQVEFAQRAAYIEALQRVRQEEALDPFVRFMLRMHGKQLSEYLDQYNGRNEMLDR